MPARRKAITKLPTGSETLELEISALGHRGDGIAHVEGQTIFVPYSAPGDRLIVRLVGEREGGTLARIERRLADGPDRVQPPCIYFGDCGGCAVQHLSIPVYRSWKQALVGDALARQGVAAEVSAMVAIPPGSRRRATFVAEKRGDEIHLGFNAMGSSRVVDLHLCHILLPVLVDLLDPLRRTLSRVLGGNETADIAITLSDSGIDLWLKSRRPLLRAAREALVALAEQCDLARISAGADAEPVALRRQPQMNFSGIAVALPPDSFLQPSAGGEAVLVALVGEALARRKTVADLYAGCGTFTFALMPRRRIHAVEGNTASLAALATAARGSSGRVTSERRDLAREPLTAVELNKFDAVVFDPPRAGAKEQTAQIARSKLKLAVAVSCNPVTFARDARILTDAGFHLAKVTPVDQFPWSAHLELVGVFSR
jgi:23S rRNA (uracil1939-C5)-methyltransferase